MGCCGAAVVGLGFGARAASAAVGGGDLPAEDPRAAADDVGERVAVCWVGQAGQHVLVGVVTGGGLQVGGDGCADALCDEEFEDALALLTGHEVEDLAQAEAGGWGVGRRAAAIGSGALCGGGGRIAQLRLRQRLIMDDVFVWYGYVAG